MKELIPTFIAVFGTISGLIIAFLILLYNASKRSISVIRESLLHEIYKCINGDSQEYDKIKEVLGEELLKGLSTNNKEVVVDRENVRSLIKRLSDAIKQLRTNISGLNNEEIGNNTKIALYIEETHLNDVVRGNDLYDKAFKFYENYYIFIRWAIGVPLFIAFLFIILQIFRTKMNSTALDVLIFIIAVGGFLYVYWFITHVFNKIRLIDK